MLCRYVTTWVKSSVESALSFLDSVANALGLQSQLDSLLKPIRDQLDRFNYDLMKQYSMQVIAQRVDRYAPCERVLSPPVWTCLVWACVLAVLTARAAAVVPTVG